MNYLGIQYRWGGKTVCGLDCSGLTFMSYWENGIIIYRDAVIKEGYAIHEISRAELEAGDLIYFPSHVAMYIGDNLYIHATAYYKNPYVTINSLDPCDCNYRDDLACKIKYYGSVLT